MQRNARQVADRNYKDKLKKSGIDYDHLRQLSATGSRAADSVADNANDDSHDEQTRSADTSPGRSSRSDRSPDRESTGRESPSHRSRQEPSGSPSAPDYTQEYDDDDGDSVIDEELETELAWCT